MTNIPAFLPSYNSLYTAAKEGAKIANAVAWPFREAVGFTSAVIASVPHGVKEAATATKFLSGATVIFQIPVFIDEVKEVYKTSSKVEKIKRAFIAASTFASMGMNTIKVIGASRNFGLIASNALAWTSIVMQILFPFLVIGTLISGYDYAKSLPDFKTINESIKLSDPSMEKERRITNITHTLQNVADKKELFEKRLKLKSELKIDEKAQSILKRLESDETALLEAEAFAKTLNRRVHASLTIDTLRLASRVAATATGGVAVFSGPNPATLGVGLAAAVVSLSTIGLDYLLLNKDPFAEKPKAYHWLAVHMTREGYFTCQDHVTSTIGKVYSFSKAQIVGGLNVINR